MIGSMSAALIVLSFASLALWAYLLAFRHGFWRADQRLTDDDPAPAEWPEVVAVVPARDEAAVVGAAMRALAGQDYPGRFSIVLVDDGSTDGTADAAARGAREAGRPDRLTVIRGEALPTGWTGKMWAVAQGVAQARRRTPGARYIWLTDADVAHPADKLRRLAAAAEHRGLALVSLMVRLNCTTAWERLLIPAFVFFFQKLYPFPAVNDPTHELAGAAGGCMLVDRAALERAGGIEAVRAEIIDDCALARRIKGQGRIWLGLGRDSRSLRPYHRLDEIWRMVARTAFTQLDYSALRLVGTVVAMALIYMVPPLALIGGLATGAHSAAVAGALSLTLMYAAYRPTWRHYAAGLPALLALPGAALLYTAMTVDSARRHWRGRGGAWKGRTYAHVGSGGSPLGSGGSPG